MQRYGAANNLMDDMGYSYTNANNQLTAVSDAEGQVYDWDGAAGSFDYDANGNLMSMTGNPAIDEITYDHRNQSIHTYFNDGVEQIANYNADGQRILKEVQTADGTIWNFYIKDGLHTLGMIANGELQYMNILGNDVTGRVVSNGGTISASGTKRYYLKDLLGSVRAVVDETGDVKENHDYGPWGVLMDERQYVEGDETTGKFTGKELDDQSGWFHYGARDYMSILGRWPAPDPLADEFPSWSPYSYAYNNPLYYTDPTGMIAEPIYDEDGNHLGNTKEGFTGQVLIYSGDEGVDFSKMSADEAMAMDGVDTYDNQRGNLSGDAKSNIWTNIASHMEGQQIYDETFSMNSIKGSKIYHDASSNGSWNSQPKSMYEGWNDRITGTDRYNYETTVENIQSSIIVHEWYSHIMKGQGNFPYLKSHRLAYKNVINYKPLWNKTTDAYKGFNMRTLLYYTKSETGRTKVDPLYRNLYNKYKGKR